MQQNDDPRNIFFNQRQQYAEGGANNGATQRETPQNNNFGAQNETRSSANPSDYDEKVRKMKELAAKYEREGEGQLVKDILNNVIEQKAAGTLSNDQLIAFCKRISPLLNAEQRGRLNALLQELLKI